MLRQLLLPAVVAVATTFAGGCRSCSSCHDYDSPVADCQCGSCGYGRAGSAAGGYVPSASYAAGPAANGRQPIPQEIMFGE